MSVPFKPHTVTVSLPDEVLDGNVLMGHDELDQGSVRGQMTPSDSGTMWERFGVNTKRGWIFMCDTDHSSKFAEGGRVVFGSRTLAVLGSPLLFDGFGSCDHISIPLEEIDN